MLNNTCIQTNNIHKKFDTIYALNGVSLNLKEGTLNGIIGPSGSGKTTLLRCLMGLMSPSSGSITYSIDGNNEGFSKVRDHIAYMPQTHSLYSDLSIIEHLEFFKEMYQIPQEEYENRKENLLRITRLAKFQNRLAGQLSGGMYKKLGLMCSLLRNPRILLLDEPTNGVDPISRREFWALLYGLESSNVTTLVATAYMDEAERCEVVHILNSGNLIDSGEPVGLLEKYKVNNFDELFLEGLTDASE